MRSRSLPSPLVLAMLLAACDAPSAAVDAATEVPDAGWMREAPMPPRPPMPPAAACPTGFGVVALEGGTACEPWPSGTRPTCASGERAQAGVGCVPLATDCGADEPPEVDAGARLVRAGSTGGDGSRALPFGTVAEAVAAGASSIALAPGSYDAPAVLDGLVITGTCPGVTTLVLPRTTRIGHAELRRLTITGPGTLTVSRAGDLALRSVEVTALAGGLRVEGAFEAREVSLHDLTTDAIVADGAVSLVLEDVSVERVAGAALRVSDETSPHTDVVLRHVVVGDLRPVPRETPAISFDSAAGVAIDGLVIEDATGHGIASFSETASLVDVVVRRLGGAALLLHDTTPMEGEATIASFWARAAGGGIVLVGGVHRAEDVVIEDVLRLGIVLIDGDATVERALVDHAVGLGIDVSSGTATLRDVHVRNVAHESSTDGGALLVEPGAIARVERALFELVEHAGMAVTGSEAMTATLTASDVEIHDVASAGVYDGMGVLSVDGGEAFLARVSIHDVLTAGLAVQDGSAEAQDLTISRVRTGEGIEGNGVVASQIDPARATTVTLDRAAIGDVERWGVIVTGPRASLDATSLLVESVRAAPCCGDALGGGAIVVHDGAHAAVRRFEARHNEWAGIIVTFDVTASFSLGTVHDNGAALVQSPTLPYNTGSSPGLELLGVVLEGALQQTEALVERPILEP